MTRRDIHAPALTTVVSQGSTLNHQLEWVDKCWQDMQQQAALGAVVRAEDYIVEGQDEAQIIDVIYAEFVLRTNRGEAVSKDEYLTRFPQYAKPLQRQFCLDGAFSSFNDSPEHCTAKATEVDQSDSSIKDVDDNTCLHRIGKYTIIARLGKGGQSEVFRAVHPQLSREVVIKLAIPSIQTASISEQFLSEGRILARLDSPHLARVFDADFYEGRPFLVTDYIAGCTLDEFASRTAPSPLVCSRLIAKVARGLSAAHRVGIVHLDIKPGNIVMSKSEEPFLIDFGLGLVRDAYQSDNVESGSLRGTLLYMSPEQAAGDSKLIGVRSDIYGLGAVLFHLLAGHAPYASDNFLGTLRAVRAGAWRQELLPRNVPTKILRILRRALSIHPEDRFQSCEQFAEALEKANRSIQRGWSWMHAISTLSLVILVIVAYNFSAREAPTTPLPPPHTSSVTKEARSLSLSIEVLAEGRFVPLAERAPLKTGDRLRISADIPFGFHASLLILTSEGKLKVLNALTSSPQEAYLRYPADEAAVSPLIGQPGTEIVFVCLSKVRKLGLSDVEDAINVKRPLPEIPEMTVVCAINDRIYVQQSARDLGQAEPIEDPEAILKARLKQIQKNLAGTVDWFEAVAFHHAG